MLLPIGQGYYESRSLPMSAQECTNWYVHMPSVEALSRSILLGTPGLTEVARTSDDVEQNRGSHAIGGVPFFVSGNSLYKVTRSGSPDGDVFSSVKVGDIEGTGRVSMADNGTQLMILVPGGKGYIYTTSLSEITSTGFTANGNPQLTVFIDGYFVVTTDTKKWIVSALNDGTSWDALDFSTAESDPDNIVAPVVYNNQIYIVGSTTTEGFHNVGGAGFPFQRSNMFLDTGCAAPFSLVQSLQSFFMIGAGENDSPAVWQFTGNDFEKKSSPAIDYALSQYSDSQMEESFSYTYAIQGDYFVVFAFPDRAYVYNQTTGIWHTQTSVVGEDSHRWRVNSIVSAYGKLLVGDAWDGRIGVVDPEEYGEYTNDIVRVAAFQPFANDTNPVIFPAIELTMESGAGSALVPSPKISMAISQDGKTFNYERTRDIGKVGDYSRRIIWRKNGRYPRFCVIRMRLSDQIKPIIIKMEATL